MKLASKLASVALLSLTAAVSQASAQSFGISLSGSAGSVSYYQSNNNYHGYHGYHSYQRPVVYQPVAQAQTYYAYPQTAYYVRPHTTTYAKPIVGQVVSHRYVKRQQVQTYYEAVPTYRNQVVGYQYYTNTHNRYYNY